VDLVILDITLPAPSTAATRGASVFCRKLRMPGSSSTTSTVAWGQFSSGCGRVAMVSARECRGERGAATLVRALV
jgi:hypothetical protein